MSASKTASKGQRAVVMGGGIAGLAAAGVLSRHFEEVTLLERDRYGASPEVRPHAPQGAHVHVLLAKGLFVLSELVPELPGWLDELGFPEGDLTYHVRVAHKGRWLPKVRSGVPIRACTRAVLEHLLARDVRRRANVTLRDGCKVEGLLGREHVRGVRVSEGGVDEEISADLVVDAMGRASPSARWLEAAGVPAVQEETLDAGVIYTSCLFEPPRGLDDDWVLLATAAAVPNQPRITATMRLGPDRMLCAVIGYGKPKPPRDAAEFVAQTRDVGVPEIHRLLQASRPASDTSVFANTQNRWRRYGRLPWFPEGLVILGDAACTLNPRYGQGMTVAALCAARLDDELGRYFGARSHLHGFGHHFQTSLEEVLELPWKMALMEDRLWVSVFSGKKPTLAQELRMKASARALRAVSADIDTHIQFMRVGHLLDPPIKMLSLKTIAAIARGGAHGEPPAGPRVDGVADAGVRLGAAG